MSEQVYRLQLQVQQDAQWMAHDPKVAALCQRYADMLAEDWMSRPVEDVSDFRRRIGCDPHTREKIRKAKEST